ncbi:MAG: 50S ribosomal protein L34e [Crenarchaeota archaeon]|nr:50S ribosomal protein L34e [Thermoproteota archaeon]
MPRPAYRSRSLRRVKRRTPGGETRTYYEKRRPGPARCALCGKPLNGVPRLRPPKLRNLPLSQKRPERPYGGVLCARCLERLLKKTIRETVLAELSAVKAPAAGSQETG